MAIKQKEVRKLIDDEGIKVCAIIETRVKSSNMASIWNNLAVGLSATQLEADGGEIRERGRILVMPSAIC